MPHVLDSFARLKQRPTSSSSRAPAARPRSICAATTSPIWALRAPPMCRWSSSATSIAAASSPARRHHGGDRRRRAALMRGFIVNKFRGDPALFAEGMAMIAARPAGFRSAWCRSSPTRTACRPRMRWRLSAKRSRPRKDATLNIAVPDPAAYRQFRRPRSARRRARRRGRDSLAGLRRCRAMPTWSSCPAPSRRSPTSPRCAAGWDIDIAAHLRRGGGCSACAAATRCWAARSPIRTASKGRPASVDGLGLLDVETVLTAEKRLVAVQRARRPTASRSRLRDAYGRDRRARSRAAVRSSSPTARRRALPQPTAA